MSRHSELHYDYRARARRLEDVIAAAIGLRQLLVDAHQGAQHFLAAPENVSAERVSGGETVERNSSVEAGMFARAWVMDALHQVDGELDDVGGRHGSLAVIHAELSKLASAGRQAAADEEPKRTNMVDCQACTRTITMTPNDRPRGGYCMACHRAWKRLEAEWDGPGGPDRLEFERTRAKWASLDEPTEVRSTIGGVDITRNGVTVSVPRSLIVAYGPSGPPEDEIARLFEGAH